MRPIFSLSFFLFHSINDYATIINPNSDIQQL